MYTTVLGWSRSSGVLTGGPRDEGLAPMGNIMDFRASPTFPQAAGAMCGLLCRRPLPSRERLAVLMPPLPFSSSGGRNLARDPFGTEPL